MQIIRTIERNDAAPVGWGVRVLLLSPEGDQGPIARRLASLGGKVDMAGELFGALSDVIVDPADYALFVVDCDGFGGLEVVQRAVMMMGVIMSRVPVILVSQDCLEQRFPVERLQPTILRAPLSAVSIKVAFEHALRDRLVYHAA